MIKYQFSWTLSPALNLSNQREKGRFRSNSKFGRIEATRSHYGPQTGVVEPIFGPQSPLDLAF